MRCHSATLHRPVDMHVNCFNSLRIFLFLCLILPFAGNYLLLLQEKETLQKDIRANLLQGKFRNELILLKFSGKEKQVILESNEEGEFEYNGTMYDVVEMHEKNDTLSCWCWPDHKETILNSKLCDFMNTDFENQQDDDERKKEMSNFFQKIYLQANNVENFVFPSRQIYCDYNNTHTVACPGTPPFLPPERS